MRRNKQVNIRVSSAERAMIRRAVAASEDYDTVSAVMRDMAMMWADEVMDEVVRRGPTVTVDRDALREKIKSEKVGVKA